MKALTPLARGSLRGSRSDRLQDSARGLPEGISIAE
jgi:hypothetical protein